MPTKTADAFDNFSGQTLAQRAPFIKFAEGEILLAKILRHSSTVDKKTGEVKPGADVLLLAPALIHVKGSKTPAKLPAGEVARVDWVAGLSACRDLPLDTEIAVKCKGKVKVERGEAWDFEIKYRSPK